MSLKLAVIGGGPAGYPAALTAAKWGAQVTLIEKAHLGGVCLHCGCIPSKSLLDIAHRLDIVRDITRFGQTDLSAPVDQILNSISWPLIQKRQQSVTQKLTLGIGTLLKQAHVTVLNGRAELVDAHSLKVISDTNEQTLSFDKLIIATGSTAFIPDVLKPLEDLLCDNSTLFQLPALPKKLSIIGAGAIGCEVATFMAALGVEVHLIEMQPRVLPNMDEALSRLLTKNLQKRGVQLHVANAVTQAQKQNGRAVITLQDSSTLESDLVLAAIGRSCDLTALHPERAGLSFNRKGLQGVDPHTLQVQPSIYAAGDVSGLCLLAHAATRQAIVAAQNACGQNAIYNNDLIPNAVYTTPELASVGISKAQAQEKGLAVKSHKAFLLANGRALTMDAADGFVEIICQADSGQLLGATLAAPNAAEMISIFTVALEARWTLQELAKVVFPHPTVSEIIAEAAAR